MHRPRIAPACAVQLLLLFPAIRAERLPVHPFTAADGLPSNTINAIMRDSHGFLWFATPEGLARFDGYEFTTYGTANGLPSDHISGFVQTRGGTYWAATPQGLARFDPEARGSRKFVVHRPVLRGSEDVNVVYEDRSGGIWCGAEGGLFRLLPHGSAGEWSLQAVPITAGPKPAADQRVLSIYEDSHGNLWVGTFLALYRRARDGRTFEYRLKPREGRDFLWNVVLEDRQGRLWAGTGSGLWRILARNDGSYSLSPAFVPEKRVIVWDMLEDPAGKLWLGTSSGLMEWPLNATPASPLRLYGQEHGLTHFGITALCADREKNLWLGSEGGGAMRIARNGFVTYLSAESFGASAHIPGTLFRDRDGGVHAAFHHVMKVLRAGRFVEITPAIPPQHSLYRGWGWHQTILQDRGGEWWVPTAEGLVRFPAVEMDALPRTPPKTVFTTRDGLRTNDIFRVYEDSRSGIWIASIGPLGENGLSRWDRQTKTLHHFDKHSSTVATAFAEDSRGSIWIGYYDGALARVRDGSYELFGPEHGLTGGGIQALHIDHAGQLWIASTRGLVRADNISEDRPHFSRFGRAEGLSSNIILCIAEDRWGRIYLATARGIDRVPSSGRIEGGRIKHFNEADGLARGELRDILFDRSGLLWCITLQGVSLFRPEPDAPRAPPPVLIHQVRVRGIPSHTWDLGASRTPMLTFAPDQNQLQVDYSGLSFAPDGVRYQYKLEPADNDWSTPTEHRTVNYSSLPSGDYQFSVRLITDELAISDPAVMRFTVLAPVWQRWWFRLLILICFLTVLYWLHRVRTMRLLELERVRTRIAGDLHDDIGSGLSQIAILAEVAHRKVNGAGAELESALSKIGSVSRELTESMSDIVWSINPRRDHLADLVQRMRRFATDLLAGGDIDFHFRVSLPHQAIQLPADLRRELYLVFKEAVNNIVRHSKCTRADIAISIDHGRLDLRIEDNGIGIGDRRDDGGNGLDSMIQRARRIHARIKLENRAHGGASVIIQAPVHTARNWLRASAYRSEPRR
jgi:ligand-binding sensor domain-containing protein/two-component sensor histidine kinase